MSRFSLTTRHMVLIDAKDKFPVTSADILWAAAPENRQEVYENITRYTTKPVKSFENYLAEGEKSFAALEAAVRLALRLEYEESAEAVHLQVNELLALEDALGLPQGKSLRAIRSAVKLALERESEERRAAIRKEVDNVVARKLAVRWSIMPWTREAFDRLARKVAEEAAHASAPAAPPDETFRAFAEDRNREDVERYKAERKVADNALESQAGKTSPQ